MPAIAKTKESFINRLAKCKTAAAAEKVRKTFFSQARFASERTIRKFERTFSAMSNKFAAAK